MDRETHSKLCSLLLKVETGLVNDMVEEQTWAGYDLLYKINQIQNNYSCNQ